jgi:hypothetical protein
MSTTADEVRTFIGRGIGRTLVAACLRLGDGRPAVTATATLLVPSR